MSMPRPQKFTMEKVNSMLDATIFTVRGRLGRIFELANAVSILVNLDSLIRTSRASKKLLIRTLFWTQIFSTSS